MSAKDCRPTTSAFVPQQKSIYAARMWRQTDIHLRARPRGFHLITDEVVAALPTLDEVEVGLLHLCLQHTSAALSINENADPTVRGDFERWFNQAVPDGAPYLRHVDEGRDDMPAHIKSSLLGCELTIPIRHGRLRLGTWQGIYLCEHRDHGGARLIVATINGEPQARRG
jgi:secondary thiamine-phosphate synthase enzyme